MKKLHLSITKGVKIQTQAFLKGHFIKSITISLTWIDQDSYTTPSARRYLDNVETNVFLTVPFAGGLGTEHKSLDS